MKNSNIKTYCIPKGSIYRFSCYGWGYSFFICTKTINFNCKGDNLFISGISNEDKLKICKYLHLLMFVGEEKRKWFMTSQLRILHRFFCPYPDLEKNDPTTIKIN